MTLKKGEMAEGAISFRRPVKRSQFRDSSGSWSMLCGMDRRRGFLFAGIHLMVAAALIGWDVHRAWHSFHATTNPAPAHLTLAAWQETESTVPFDPCHGKGYVDYFISPQQRTIEMDNLPVWVLAGWSIPCPPSWTLAGIIRSDSVGDTFPKYLATSAGLCALVPIQWFLIGAFPLLARNRWFWEPGTLITVCTFISVLYIVLAFVLPLREISDWFYAILMLFVSLVWLFWLTLLVWKCMRKGWKISIRRAATNI
jgi:hypothetical protein